MAYEKQNFLDGQIITADHLNHIEDGIIAAQNPRNLLDNSDFTNPVNQRGQTNYQTPWGMTIDRWYLSSYDENNATLTLTTNGVVITPGTSGIAAIAQRLLSEDLHADKAYTALAQTLDGTYVTGTVENHTDTYGFYQIVFKVSAEATLVWAALYEGSYDVSTLPPYVPKGYAVELAECRRYYRNREYLNCAKTYNDYFSISKSIEMRVIPTVQYISFAPYGAANITDFSNCSMEISNTSTGVQRITWVKLPTCAEYNAGGLAVNLYADI